ncbi:MAG: signal peptidase II [Acidimicrobiales bacterium]
MQERGTVSPLNEERRRGDPQRNVRLVLVIACAAAVLIVDQVAKSFAVHDLANGPMSVVGPLSFQLSYNTGAAFSIGAGLTLPIIVIAFVLVLLLAWFARGTPSTLAAAATGTILGGALGNLADRLFRGHSGAVVDFIHLGFWPTFNVADASIVIGTIALLIEIVRGSRRGSPRVRQDRP